MRMKTNPRKRNLYIVSVLALLLFAAGAVICFFRSASFSMAAVKILFLASALSLFLTVYHTGLREAALKCRTLFRERPAVCMLGAALFVYLFLYIKNERGIVEPGGRVSLLFGLLTLLLLPLCMLLFRRRAPFHRIYLLLGLVFGLFYVFLSIPGRIPDEHVHIAGAYYVSDKLLGTQAEEDHRVFLRKSDNEVLTENTEDIYADKGTAFLIPWWDSLAHDRQEDAEPVLSTYKTPGSAAYQYFLPGLGITAARLLRLGPSWTFFLGRIMNLLFSVFLVTLAIRVAPFGKPLFFILAMTPMFLQQASSFSYDAFVNAAAFALTALTAYLAAGAYENKRNACFCAAGLCVLAILLFPAKSYALFGLSLMPLILLFPAREDAGAGKAVRRIVIWLFAGAAVFFLLAKLLPLLSGTSADGQWAVDYLARTGREGYTLTDLLREPRLLLFYANATIRELGYYLETMLGMRLGWMSVGVDHSIIYGYLAALVTAVFATENEAAVPGRLRVCFAAGALLAAACTIIGMLLTWTPVGAQTVEGVQGRYFLCLMPALLLAARTKKTRHPEVYSEYLVYAVIVLTFFTVLWLLRA